jgi:hypothetical protein
MFSETYDEVKPITASHLKCNILLLWNQSFGIWKHRSDINQHITYIGCVYMNANNLSRNEVNEYAQTLSLPRDFEVFRGCEHVEFRLNP